MTLDDARDAPDDAVMRFRNQKLREGVKEMTPRQWAEEFRSWLSVPEFEADYERTMRWLSEAGLG